MHPFIPPDPSAARNSGFEIGGFVVGLIGLMFAFMPIIGLIASPILLIGLVLSIIGLVQARKRRATNSGMAIAGISVSAAGLIICIVWWIVFNNVINNLVNAA